MASFLAWLRQSDNTRTIKKFDYLVQQINELEKDFIDLSDEDLLKKSDDLRSRSIEDLDSLLPESFALVREAAKRTTGLRPFDVQLLGGIALHKGNIAEMRTGEGKTLVATLPAYLHAIKGDGVHIVTVNDYLARRDAVWMGQVYASLGMSVGVVNGEQKSYIYDPEHEEADKKRDEEGSFRISYEFLRPVSRKEAYAADITYGTNNEFVFDYLRDNIAYKEDDIVHRGFPYAIVDEIDSILIDEARSPLIISTPSQTPASFFERFASIAKNLRKGEDYELDEKLKAVSLTEKGIKQVEQTLGVENIYVEEGASVVHHLHNALKAKNFFLKDKEYVLQEGQAIIVDEFTGRMQPGRRWKDGLHQAIEAKEGLKIQEESRTFASITFQNYFRMYDLLCGMTGTALSSAEEFYKVYKLEVLDIPTHREVKRVDTQDAVFVDEEAKITSVINKIKELHSNKQPVLVGTPSIEHNERLSKRLTKEGIPYQMLNAKNHEREGEIIASAGSIGGVTLATNLAGRGVDIKLGGVPFSEKACEEVKGKGGLFVLGTERNESRRIDDQLRGRTGRQGDPGETQFFVSLEDSLMKIFGSERLRNMFTKLKLPKDRPISNPIVNKALDSAQKRLEGYNFDSRRWNLEYDNVLDTHRDSVYKLRRSILLGKEDEIEEICSEYLPEKEVLDKKKEEDGYLEFLRTTMLRSIDIVWIHHLEHMDHVQNSVGLRSYGQKEPVLEYKKEGQKAFDNFWDQVKAEVAHAFSQAEK